MPTENERKFVLQNCEDEILACTECKVNSYFLKQGYLAFAKGMTLRIRSAQSIKGGEIKYKLCFKQKVTGRVIEIEKKIDERDFLELWDMSLNKVEKIRHVLKFKDSAIWEVDFFKYHNDTYFILAEHEMPEGQLVPNYIPDIIDKNLIYSVPIEEDYDYSTKRLACVNHAKKLYTTLNNTDSN